LELAAPPSVIAHRPLHIDLGGIAKGYAVDRALTALRAAGCRGGLVNAGGDLAVFGHRTHAIVIRGEGPRDGVLSSRMPLSPPAKFAAQHDLPNTAATTTASLARKSEPVKSASAPRALPSPMP